MARSGIDAYDPRPDAWSVSHPARPDGSPGTASEAGAAPDGSLPPDAGGPALDTLASNRDRLLVSYLVHLKATPGTQSNGLSGATVTDV